VQFLLYIYLAPLFEINNEGSVVSVDLNEVETPIKVKRAFKKIIKSKL
jgi:hypothetical protein